MIRIEDIMNDDGYDMSDWKPPVRSSFGRRGAKQDPELRARYRKAAGAGMTMTEAAESLGVTLSAVSSAARRYGLVFAKGKPGRPRTAAPPAPEEPASRTTIEAYKPWLEAKLKEGLKEYQMAEILNVEAHRVIFALRTLGLKGYDK